MQITKQDFERALPVGTSAHIEVFQQVQPAIEGVATSYASQLLGKEGNAMLADIHADNYLPQEYKRLVCLTAFRSVLRQIDLVLTPTGFGIVSSGGVAPAAKHRVDALYYQLLDEEMKARATVVFLLRSLSWGTTVQATYALPYLYTAHRFFFVDSYNTRSANDWDNFQSAVWGTDAIMRNAMGDAQMDELLRCYRCKSLSPKHEPVVEGVCRLTVMYAQKGNGILKSPLYRQVMQLLDEDAETFSQYHQSVQFKANHHENFQNRKDSAGFFFNG